MYEVFPFVFLALLSSFSLLPIIGYYAQEDVSLTLEKEENWTGCIPGGHNVFVNDVDDDGVLEIITGGLTYGCGMLNIWSWDGENLTLERGHKWSTINRTSVLGVYASEVDGDGDTEIITAGVNFNGTVSFAQLRIWCWDGATLVLENSEKWCASEEAVVNSVYAYDVDGDGVIEIITGGFDDNLEKSSGQIRIWNWNGETMALEKSQEWQMVEGTALDIVGHVMGNTIVAAARTSDVDEDGFPEIVTGGFTYDGTRANAQLRVWSWDGETLVLENSHEWCNFNLTEVKSVSIEDVDGDGEQEIVTSEFVWNGTSLARLSVWNWDGKTLALKSSQIWCSGDGACPWNVDAGDVDKDGVTEIVTVGCMFAGIRCSGHLRIWSIPRPSTFPLYGLYVAVAIVAIVIVLAAAHPYMRKKPKTT